MATTEPYWSDDLKQYLTAKKPLCSGSEKATVQALRPLAFTICMDNIEAASREDGSPVGKIITHAPAVEPWIRIDELAPLSVNVYRGLVDLTSYPSKPKKHGSETSCTRPPSSQASFAFGC